MSQSFALEVRLILPKVGMLVLFKPCRAPKARILETLRAAHNLPMEHPDKIINLKFLKWQPLYEIEKPFQIFINIPDHVEDKRTTNLVFEDVKVSASDVRTCQTNFNLDHHGFQYCHHSSAVEDFSMRDVVEKWYLPEMEMLLKNKLEGVDRVFFFDWRVTEIRVRIPQEPDLLRLNSSGRMHQKLKALLST